MLCCADGANMVLKQGSVAPVMEVALFLVRLSDRTKMDTVLQTNMRNMKKTSLTARTIR